MISKLKFSIASIVLFLMITYPVLADGGYEVGGNQQTPIQVIVAIAISAIVLKVLSKFNLP